MRTHTLPWTFEELGKDSNKSLQVEFECQVTLGSPGGYWEPPDPTEIEFADVEIVELLDGDGEIAVNPSWHESLRQIAFGLAEQERERLEEALSERVGDYEDAAREEYYERKREQLKGY
jgi:hypothetical protein